jgi:hypothetical protein
LKQIQQRAGIGGASADDNSSRPRTCSPKTLDQYAKAAERVIRQRMQLQSIAALSKNSFYFYRAAINSQMPQLLYQHLVELKHITPGTPDWDQRLETINLKRAFGHRATEYTEKNQCIGKRTFNTF